MVAEDGDWEPTSLTGVVADGEPHVYVAAHGTDRTPGGHLLPGSEVKALAATPPALRREADGDDVRRLTDR